MSEERKQLTIEEALDEYHHGYPDRDEYDDLKDWAREVEKHRKDILSRVKTYPSDEEIKQTAKIRPEPTSRYYIGVQKGFANGAKWVRDTYALPTPASSPDEIEVWTWTISTGWEENDISDLSLIFVRYQNGELPSDIIIQILIKGVCVFDNQNQDQ